MKSSVLFLAVVIMLPMSISTSCVFASGVNLITTNPGFEGSATAPNQPSGWQSVWAREPGTVTGTIDQTTAHNGQNSYRIDSASTQDWAFAYSQPIDVHPNDLIRLDAWVKCKECDDAEISVVERGSGGNVIDWEHGLTQIHGTVDWTELTSRFIVDPGCTQIQFRFTGTGKGTSWIDDTSVTSEPLPAQTNPGSMQEIVLSNHSLTVTLSPKVGYALQAALTAGSLSHWSQLQSGDLIVLKAVKIDKNTARIDYIDRVAASKLQSIIHLDPQLPEVTLKIVGDAAASQQSDIAYPAAYETSDAVDLDIPNNEGIDYPAEDQTVQPYWLPLYSGQSMSMSWFGQYDRVSGAGVMTIVQTPDDAILKLERDAPSGLLINQLAWSPSKGKYGYDRVVSFVFFAHGGYVAQAKRYRAYAEKIGLVRTLAQKRATDPNVDKLIGAADIWDWDSKNVIDEINQWKAAGFDRVLWANGGTPELVDQVNALGYLSGKYDIYQDEYSTAAPSWLPKSPNWPNDLVVDKNGNYVQSWVDYETGPDGKKISYVADAGCSLEMIKWAQKNIPLDLSTHHYTARFIDTATASAWRECYSPVHPTTRSQDKAAKMRILDYVCKTEHLVTGSETGNDCAVPYEDYFEGMESIGQYRLPNAGYDPGGFETPTPDFLKYQIGFGYRIPLFELVYHDCMVTTWYWGDASNQEPDQWHQRDLWNVLYGTNPLYVLDANRWAQTKERLVQSYNDVSSADRAVGYAQMVDHSFLSADKSVQQTTWSNGVKIIVNFGDTPYQANSEAVPASGYVIIQAKNKRAK